MALSDRIHDTLENWQAEWKDRLRGWMASWVIKGVEGLLEDIEPDSISDTRSAIDKILANPATPPQVRSYLEGFQRGGFSPLIVIGIVMIIAMIIQTVSTIWVPGNRQMEYVEERVAQTWRLDPIAIITAWRRDPAKYAHLFEDLKDQGWSEDRIEALKFYTLFYPSPQDMVTWQAKEVFEPDMIRKYNLDEEFTQGMVDAMDKAGVTREQALNYWRAHWEHPEWRTIVEMLRRTDFSESDMREWFRLVEIPTFWRQKLIDISYEVPTRVDVRRWWDMRTIDEARLREIYIHQGYHGKDLEDYILWTKVYVAFPDLIARWKNGWITEDDVRSELTALGMPAARVEEFLQTKIANTEAERTIKERDLTKTEVYKGVKKGVITWDQGLELLRDLGYSQYEAEFILQVNVGVLEGSPGTFKEFKEWTQRWRKATEIEIKEVPMEPEAAAPEIPPESQAAGQGNSPELKATSQHLITLTADVDALKRAEAEELRGMLPEALEEMGPTEKLKEIRVALHRAESALHAARTHYNELVARFKHQAET